MGNKFKSYIRVYSSADTRKIFEKNEMEANRLSGFVLLACSVILVVSWVLNSFGIFTVDKTRMNYLAIQGLIELMIPLALFFVYNKKNRGWLKYVMLISLLLVCTRLFSVLNHNVILIMTLPILLSSRYFSRGLTVIISALSMISLLVASVATVFWGIIDLNFYPNPPEGTSLVIHNTLRESLTALGADTSAVMGRVLFHGFLPRLLVFLLIAMISVLISKHGFNMVIEQEKVSRASAKVKLELDAARQIQTGVVPSLFPAFPDRHDFELYASMKTAKQVGGDFYDFFFVDDDHLAIVIADVSDKGVPAALFMMAAKILISDRALMGGTPSEILSFVNKRICESNDAEMFVTVWLGIIDLKTGKAIASNAGHEFPVFRRNGGDFEVLHDDHSFVVGGMTHTRYKDYEFTLKKGDSLFLYTDGVPEANNKEHMLFSTEKMVGALNREPNASPDKLIDNVFSELDAFVQGFEQTDDITMLGFTYIGSDE